MSLTLLHFSDAHIGVEQAGRRDAQTDLPLRVLDYLKSLDTIVDTAIQKKVDLVLFSGDAYHSRTPSPTLQREWGRRIMRLSRADIPTLLLVGNHDLSPAYQRAHALDSFVTLDVPNITVIDRPCFLPPGKLNGLPIQVIAIPWINRSGLMASMSIEAEANQVYETIQNKLIEMIQDWINQAEPSLPLILTAHTTVQGVDFGGYGTITINNEVVLPPSLLKNKGLDYVGLGHIHKTQNLNEGIHPPVVYAGSIERVNFGESGEQKGFYLANIERGKTTLEWNALQTRPYLTCEIKLSSPQNLMESIWSQMPSKERIKGSVFRLMIEYHRDWEAFIDEAALRNYALEAFEFKIVRRPLMDLRVRLPDGHEVSSLTPLEMLNLYWKANHFEQTEIDGLAQFAKIIFEEQDQFTSRGN